MPSSRQCFARQVEARSSHQRACCCRAIANARCSSASASLRLPSSNRTVPRRRCSSASKNPRLLLRPIQHLHPTGVSQLQVHRGWHERKRVGTSRAATVRSELRSVAASALRMSSMPGCRSPAWANSAPWKKRDRLSIPANSLSTLSDIASSAWARARLSPPMVPRTTMLPSVKAIVKLRPLTGTALGFFRGICRLIRIAKEQQC